MAGSGRRPGAWAVVGVSLAALAAGTFAVVGLGVLAPELGPDLGLSLAEIGFLTSLVFIGAMISSRRAGRLTDSVGATLVLAAALVVFAAGMAVAAVAPGAAALMAAVFLAGLAYGGINPPTNVVVAGQLARKLGFFLSVKQSGVPLGGLLAGVVLPPIALAFGWRWALAVTVAVALAVAASTPLLRGAAVLRGPAEHAEQAPLCRRELLGLGFFGFVMSGSQWTFLTYLALYLTEEAAFSLGEAGLALALAQGLGAGGRLLWGWLSDAPGRRVPILLLVAAVSSALLATLASGVGPTALWPVVAGVGLALIGWNGAYHALLADRAGPGKVGRASGDALVFVFAGSVVLPPLLGLLADSVDSWRPLWAAEAGFVAVSGVVLWAALCSPLRRVARSGGPGS